MNATTPVERQIIVIPACEQHEGHLRVTLRVPWCCIYCGERRGTHAVGLSYDGSRRLAVSMWRNPCGHTETYAAVRDWLNVQAELGTLEADTFNPTPQATAGEPVDSIPLDDIPFPY
jgi:hypothetical protein